MDFKFQFKNAPFLGLLLLFAGFSLYGVISFNSSLSDYSNTLKATVVDGNLPGGALVTDAAGYGVANPEGPAPKLIFVDVTENHPNATAIAYFKQMGYAAGYDDGTFKPDNLVNRAEFAKMLTDVAGADFKGGIYEKCFSDVKTEWYAAFVCYANSAKWVSGYMDGTFKPGQTVSKAEALVMTLKALGMVVPSDELKESPFKDVPTDIWYALYAKFAKDKGIVATSRFLGNTSMTRASSVQLIYDVLHYLGKV